MSAEHTTEHSSLRATSLTQEQHEHTCGYWYTVTSGALAHTAFATRAGLDRWLDERGLALEGELPVRGEWGSTRIVGSYRQCSHLDVGEFDAVDPVLETPVMSNGDYTLGRVEEVDGVRVVHYLNPNVRSRPVFDYFATQKQMS